MKGRRIDGRPAEQRRGVERASSVEYRLFGQIFNNATDADSSIRK